MPRKPIILSDEFPYHVTNRSNNKEFFYLPMDELWELFLEIFTKIKQEYHCEILQFVLMSNHYHLLIYTPKKNLSECMHYLHREIAKRANSKTQRKNHFWGTRYSWCLIQDETYFWNVVKYIFRNPVEAEMCKSTEDYLYSSLNQTSPIFSFYDFFSESKKNLKPCTKWLNESFGKDEKSAIQNALRKSIFKPSKNKNRAQIFYAPPPQKVCNTV